MPGWLTRWFLRARAIAFRPARSRAAGRAAAAPAAPRGGVRRAGNCSRTLARRRARREFGNATLFQEASHDLFSFRLLEDLRPGSCATRCARCGAARGSRASRWCRSPSASAPSRPPLPSSTPSCFEDCRCATRSGWSRLSSSRPPDLGQLDLRASFAVARFVRGALRGRGQLRRTGRTRRRLRGQRRTGRRARQSRVRQLLSGDGRRHRRSEGP